MQTFVGVLKNYYKRDAARIFWLKQRLFWIHYERFEYTRLSQIRREMDMHRTYKKEYVLGEDEDEEKSKADAEYQKQSRFIWTFLIRPVHEK